MGCGCVKSAKKAYRAALLEAERGRALRVPARLQKKLDEAVWRTNDEWHRLLRQPKKRR